MTVEAHVSARQAVVGEQADLARTLAAAFIEDPVFVWLLPRRTTRAERRRRFFTIELRHLAFPRGTVWTCDGLRGAAICMPPGAWQLPPRISAALYERLRFEHVRELRLAGSPPLWLMLRPPRRE
jgi:hypothetical protein